MVATVFAVQASVGAVQWGVGAVNVATGNITGHEAQARYAEGRHVQVVASLPRSFARGVEVGVLDGVGKEDRIAAAVVVTHTDVVERGFAVDLLEAEGQGVCGHERIRCCQGESGVADIARFLGTGICCAVDVEIPRQGLRVSDRHNVVHVSVVLVPDVL